MIASSNKKTSIPTYKKNSSSTVLFFPNKQNLLLSASTFATVSSSFPTPPAIDIPRWSYDGGTYTEPPLTNRQIGWAAVPGQNYAQPPPYQWVNWLSYSTGEWINYVAAYAIPYLQNGNFDNGINVFNNNSAKFYNAANDKYTSIRSSNSQTSSGIDLVLPPSLPSNPLPLVGNGAGNLNFSTISSSAVAGITSGSAPISGQVGEYFVYNNEYLGVPYDVNTVVTTFNFTPGVWTFSYNAYFSIGNPPSSSFTQNRVTIWISLTSGPPSPVINAYNDVSEWSMGQVMTVTLPCYLINSSSIFSLYFGTRAASNIAGVGSNMWYSIVAQRIA